MSDRLESLSNSHETQTSKLSSSRVKESVEFFFKENLTDFTNQKFLIAVSGGADSMALLHTVKSLEINCGVAHVNYHLRGKDSDRDEELVKSFCQKNQIPFHLHNCQPEDFLEANVQIRAREIRYQFFNNLCEKENYDFILTAHHADDAVETFMMHLARGSGISGLSSIPKVSANIIRPFLSLRKKEILAYVEEHHIPYKEDVSNKKDQYLRNYFRNRIIPEIENRIPEFSENVIKSISHISLAKDFILQQLNLHRQQALLFADKEFERFDLEAIQSWHPLMQYEFFHAYGITSAEEIQKFLSASHGASVQVNKGIQLKIYHKELWIEFPSLTKEEKIEGNTVFISQYLKNKYSHDTLSVVVLNKDKVSGTLHLCEADEAEVFYPSGMKGKKSVKKFLKDLGITAEDRGKVKVLKDEKKQIHAVLPWRLSCGHETPDALHKKNKLYFYIAYF